MPYVVAINDIIEVRLVARYASQTSFNVIHGRIEIVTGGSVTDVDLAASIDTSVEALMKPLLTAAAQYRGVGVKVLTGLPAPIEATATTNAGPGTAGSTPLPTQDCGLIRFRTDVAGRSGHGRIFTPFPDIDLLVAGSTIFSVGTVTAMQALGTYFVGSGAYASAFGTATVQWGILNRKIMNLTPTTFLRVSNSVATQRRRGAFGKINANWPST